MNPTNSYTITIGPKVKVITDKKSKSRVSHFPFELPDGSNGVFILCRIKDEEWVPANTIKDITITFK